jgi:hypothetical protein
MFFKTSSVVKPVSDRNKLGTDLSSFACGPSLQKGSHRADDLSAFYLGYE